VHFFCVRECPCFAHDLYTHQEGLFKVFLKQGEIESHREAAPSFRCFGGRKNMVENQIVLILHAIFTNLGLRKTFNTKIRWAPPPGCAIAKGG
jgi:hypothetical protein